MLDYSDYAVISSDRRSVALTITDGGFGDLDGIAIGIIIDPSGLGTPSGSSSGGGSIIDTLDDTIGDTIGNFAGNLGCFITAVQQRPTARLGNLWPGIGGCLLIPPLLPLVAVAVRVKKWSI